MDDFFLGVKSNLRTAMNRLFTCAVTFKLFPSLFPNPVLDGFMVPAPAAPLPTFVDTGTAVIDENNLAAFRKALSEHPKPM